MKTLRYDPKSTRSGLTLVTLLCWILPILIIVTMFSILVNYYNDRNLEQAMALMVDAARQQPRVVTDPLPGGGQRWGCVGTVVAILGLLFFAAFLLLALTGGAMLLAL